MKHLVMITCAVLMLAGCTEIKERSFFEGKYYPPKTRVEKGDRRNFTASVRRASRGINGAQQAAVHEATRYCLESFGTSEIEWSGVAKGEGPVYGRSGDTVSVTGRCIIWK
ncbi:MAG: hypothetical protein RQ750_18180 [Roseovarius sp.]|nr:hypothetical protein [Roseovarius sp.]